MIPRILGAMAVTAAALAILVATLFQNPSNPPGTGGGDEKLAFAKVLEGISSAKTMHLKLTRNGDAREIWFEKGGRLRIDSQSGSYILSDGEMAWRIDEKTGKAARVNDRPPTGVLALVLDGHKHEKFDPSKTQPSEKRTIDGVEYHVYRLKIDAPNGGIAIEALVDAKSLKLHSLAAFDQRGKQPFAELFVTAVNEDLPENKFLVLNSLSEDGRVGKITDTQGVVTVKPMAQERWTPIGENFVMMPGDWLRTDARGANAAEVKLISRTGLILGPGSLLEVSKSTKLKLVEGEVEISAPKGTSIELNGPDDQKVVVKGTQYYFLDKSGKLRLGKREPLWLKGFKGATANESIGSLITKVDGRAVPLSVGYHKVTVDIRDQIARTTIEESFVNHTDATLEGQFHFPLPQDASISGFGMWIGEQLVEADVVEKQRAREIYEQIMREKRDPGLLEWAGGNIFKARVWPITPHSEKRIKITYTQVLPLKGNKYTYSYALQSELLQQHPLRELALTVNVNSTIALKKVSSPTHSTRDQATRNSARVEFTAQEYTPRKDFEVVIEQDQRSSDVVMIPHRRGNDGYFLLQVMPPAASQERAVLQDSGPIRLLILADTSASMDRQQRQNQQAFISALVSSLTPKDSFNLACCDVTCDWVFEKPAPADGKNLIAARQMLDDRISLGWSDLEHAFASAMEAADAKTQIVYVGDGIPVSQNIDPVAFAKKLKTMYGKRRGVSPTWATFHSVATGSSFESGVLKAMASLGGGSARKIGGEDTPSHVALELMREMTQPTLRNVTVEFRGLRTARVYPGELPNVPAGMQQILLGRYLPEGGDQSGEVIVSGMLDGKPVKMIAKVDLKDAVEGNSFIPRLWARMHLDALLEQGSSEAIKDEIIALSEEYNIITPYTSFLVLESDADRERFGVKKRFRMRDGEKFFADSRDKVRFDLVQQQMKRAGTWRLNLRRQVLRELAGLGRNVRLLQPLPDVLDQVVARRGFVDLDESGTSRPTSGTEGVYLQSRFDVSGVDLDSTSGLGVGSGFGGGVASDKLSKAAEIRDSEEPNERPFDGREKEKDEKEALTADEVDGERSKGKKEGGESRAVEGDDRDEMKKLIEAGEPGNMPFASGPDANTPVTPIAFESTPGLLATGGRGYANGRLAPLNEGYFKAPGLGWQYNNESIYWQREWWSLIFPPLPKPAKPAKFAKSNWPEAAKKLAESLLRIEQLKKLKGGLEYSRTYETFDHRYGNLTGRSLSLDLYSPNSWLNRSRGDLSQTVVYWADDKECGMIQRAFELGRIRPAEPGDLDHQLPTDVNLTSSLEHTYATYSASVEDAGQGKARLVLKSGVSEVHYLIDTVRHIVLAIEYRTSGKVTNSAKFEDYVEVAGIWWPLKVEHFLGVDKPKLGSRTTVSVRELSGEEFAKRRTEELAGRDQVLFFEPLPKVSDAKRAVAAGKAALKDHATMLRYFAASQQWTKVREHLEAIEKLTDKPGKRWLRDAVLHLSRRYDELRQRHLTEATKLADSKRDVNDAYAIAQHLYSRSSSFLQSIEMMSMLDKFEPVYKRMPAYTLAMKTLLQQRISYSSDPFPLAKRLALEYPRDAEAQRSYSQHLANRGDYPAALAWLEKALAGNDQWTDGEEESLRNQYVQLLQTQGRYDDVLKFVEIWMSKNPAAQSPYSIYLGTLIRLDKENQANARVAEWLKERPAKGEMTPAAISRLSAAMNLAAGRGHFMQTYRIEERWLPALIAAVRDLARDEKYGYLADQIMGMLQGHPGDDMKHFRQEFANVLAAEADKLAPARIERIIYWTFTADVEAEQWTKIAAAIRRRWEAEKEQPVRQQLANTLIYVLRNRGMSDDLLAFLRLQWRQADDANRAQSALQLFNTLLEQPWKQSYEDEAFTMLDKLGVGLADVEQARVKAEALYRLTDTLVRIRAADLNAKIDRPDQLTRTELRDRQKANLKSARTAVADRLAEQFAKSTKELAPWLKIERMYLDVILDRNLEQVAADCWEIVGTAPPKPADLDAEVKPAEVLESLRKTRAFTMLNYLALRKKADPALIDRLLKYIDAGIAQEGERSAWKSAKHHLLVALDRPKDLEKDLRAWVDADKNTQQWRLHLAFLLAELGKLEAAVSELEKVEAADELGPLAYRTLADWYMVLNKKDKHEQALLNQYRTMQEQLLSRRIEFMLRPWLSGGAHLPSELDPEVLRMFTVLFEKSAQPANYVYQLQRFYQACRDFRLLSTMADAVIGQTPVKVYPFLQNLRSVMNEIQDEATVDEMMKHLESTRKLARTTTDKRALDLLELFTQRRAAELRNQPAPHGDKALAALKRAFDRDWAQGEQLLMANLLYSLGNIAYDPLAKEQARELDWLHKQQKKGTLERLTAGTRLGQIIYGYGRKTEAEDVIESELVDFAAANGGTLPVSANESIMSLVQFLQQDMHHTRAEKFLLGQLQRPANMEQEYFLTERLDTLYHHALANHGEVSLGTGQTLYAALEKKLRADAANQEPYKQYRIIQVLCEVYATAKNLKLENWGGDLTNFANKLLPEILKFQHSYYDSIVGQVSNSIYNLLGPAPAIAFLLDRIEKEPAWFRLNNQDGWSRHGGTLAYWRSNAKDIGDLEPRLLKLTLDELRLDLTSLRARNRQMYYRGQSYYWSEKEDEFVKVAEEVYAKRKDSGESVKYIADYLFHGVNRTGRAIEILYAALERKLLDEGGESQLVQYLRGVGRHPDAIKLLVSLVGRRPENLTYRTWMMNSYFHTKQTKELLAALKDAHDYFHQEKRWNEGVCATLGASCLENELWSQSAEYYQEAIPLRQRASRTRGIGDGTLCEYYSSLARAYSKLGRTGDAVDAASGAIVAWPHNQNQRQAYLNRLMEVLTEAKDLDAYVGQLDAKEKEVGQGVPVIRKALGKAYQSRNEFSKAIVQYRAAAELQPEDFETYDLLVACYDQLNDKVGAVRASIEGLQLARRNLALYEKLGDRFASLKDFREAERAYTSIVEMQPNEAEAHAQFALVRQRQNRWEEAIPQWEQAVQMRALEPTNLIELCKAQIHLKQWNKAEATLRNLEQKAWPARFDNLREQIRALRRQVSQSDK